MSTHSSCIRHIGDMCAPCHDKKLRKDCKNLYMNYKAVCSQINKCQIGNIDVNNKEDLINGINRIHTNIKNIEKCMEDRAIHSKKCVDRGCVDDGHKMYVDILAKRIKICDKRLNKLIIHLKNLDKLKLK